MPSFTINSDAEIVAPKTTSTSSDAEIVGPRTNAIKSDAFITTSTTLTTTSDAVFKPFVTSEFIGGDGSNTCRPTGGPLVEGVDYELDAQNGRIKFLSTGKAGLASYPIYGYCGIAVDACCENPACQYLTGYKTACDSACYVQEGYDTVLQEGAEDYRSSDEKMIKRATLEAEPEPESSPPELQCDIGFAKQPNCMKWVPVRPLLFECQSNKTAAQHEADRTRPDDSFHFPTWQRGQYISTRFRVTGIGGAGDFSAIHKLVKGWGQHDAP